MALGERIARPEGFMEGIRDAIERRIGGIEHRLMRIEVNLFGVEPEAAQTPYAGAPFGQLAADALMPLEGITDFRVTALKNSPAAHALGTIFAE